MADGWALKKGLPVVISAPAGTGKGTVIAALMERSDAFSYSVSATTRAPRPGEIDGVHYHFLTREAFEERIASGRMLEYTEYCGNYYGTPLDFAEAELEKGRHVIFEIEIEGAMNIRRSLPEAVLIMITPPSFRVLEQRLRDRGTNTEEDILNRLARAKEELGVLGQYDYVVPNETGQVERAAEEILHIVESESRRIARRGGALPDDFYC